ncbi:DUF4362 domain-containing protein [Paenibacillus albicereus]|uniref:DUF4362 domain-containing protein n=1 Tax=Paenibacillus albicereus TaxID=2726185 RepID=A0A6H2GTR0_9BACL|nr:DUF4362 domain-containing protein [Paenibacillus albicereus]QJC50787.1 DUF4362 domain-containing protein [Paenibacillus albicereus]
MKRRRKPRALALLLLAVLLAGGCSSGSALSSGSGAPTPSVSEAPASSGDPAAAEPQWEALALPEQGRAAFVSRSLRFGGVNPAPLALFEEGGQVRAFEEAIRSSERIEGILDVAEPDFDLVLQSEGGARKAYHLWLPLGGAKTEGMKGMAMEAANTHTGYTISATAAKQLAELVLSQGYTSEQAARNGDVVFGPGRQFNEDVWQAFVEKVGRGEQASVQVTSFTIEGDPIFENLSHVEGTIRYQKDTRFDGFGSREHPRVDFCKRLEEGEAGEDKVYSLAECGEEVSPFLLRLAGAGGGN